MKGVFVTDVNRTAILDLPEPEVGPYEALVQMEACGICNSTDWKIIKGEFVSGTFPILLGHESVGRVIRVGEQVRSFHIGDRVLRPGLRDEHVPFAGGRSCWGGFVERALVTDAWAETDAAYNAFPHPQQIVPAEIPAEPAVALITLKETMSCLQSTDVQPGHSLAIVGTGPVAQALTLFAALLAKEGDGFGPVVVFGRREVWADRFANLGADAYVVGDDRTSIQDVMQGGGFDRAIEAVGARSALSRCLQVTKPEGRVNLYGIAPESEPYLEDEETDPRVFRGKVAEAEAHDQLLGWVQEGSVRLEEWVSHQMPWTEYERGFELVKSKTANKVVLTF
jgi:threonine dehydrogenase-like Zn-dependent dehydrogenase